jgi:hypothetical protein
MTANQPLSSAAPDGLAAHLACLGLPAAGAQDRQDAEPSRDPAESPSTEQR